MNSEDRAYLVKYRFAKAKKTFNEVELHIQNELWATAANRLYYACFYAVTSLLLSREINSKTHAGTKQMFGLNFIKPGIISEELGDYYTFIFELRQTGDYDDYFEFGRDEVIPLLQPANALISKIEEILFNENTMLD